ncbi:uncharacterized protein [Littorina saxatilis]|uniref:uncharacterized protein n=1 Tax=Littorina saxatilis TaxID=31220 RepID=UPI0038B491E7
MEQKQGQSPGYDPGASTPVIWMPQRTQSQSQSGPQQSERELNAATVCNPGTSSQTSANQMTTSQQPVSCGQFSIPPTVEREPQTLWMLVWSTFTAIFCFPWCGLLAIGVAWQARLQVIDKKYDHARHSRIVAAILNGVATLFGIGFWTGIIILIIQLTTASRGRNY